MALLPQPCTSSTPIFPVSLPPVIPVAQHGPATTQPTTITSTISHASLLRPHKTNEDALSTASDTLLPEATVPGGHTDPSVSVSLPPVPLAVQHRILRGEFIDFNSLLPQVMFFPANTTLPINANRFTMQPARINSFSSWLDVWNTYISTTVACNPSRASELLGYQRLIHSASKHFSTPAWLNYYVQFRILATPNPQLRWNLGHSELWLENLVSQSSSGHLKLIGLVHTAAAHPTFPIDVLVVLFIQSNYIVTAVFSEVVEQQCPHAESSMASPAFVTPAITDITATAVVPPITLHTGAMGNHLFPAEVSGTRTQTPYDHSFLSVNWLITLTKLLFSS